MKDDSNKLLKFDIYNCHVHTFNLNHVNNKFAKGMFVLGITPTIGFVKRLRGLFRRLHANNNPTLRRFAYLLLHSYSIKNKRVKAQREIISNLKSYYPKNTKFVVHTMDLDYMVDGKSIKNSQFIKQLIDLDKIKNTKINKDIILPFIHTDPRRIEQYPFFYKRLCVYLQNKVFNGIKIYPALGYFPFDKRLKAVYDLALKYNVPITAHCSVGPVYYRGKKKDFKNEDFYQNGKFIHPKTKKELLENKAKYFTQHFTHPLNYACLYDTEFLSEYWNISTDEAKKYSNLKICLAHYGGSNEWERYLKFPWSPHRISPANLNNWDHSIKKEGFWKNLRNWFIPKEPIDRVSWYSIITEMLIKYPNLYTDISFSLSDEEILPLLKISLMREKISDRILFGTDFYMVSTEGAERELTIKLRAFIGEHLFKKIAHDNAKKFLYEPPTKK